MTCPTDDLTLDTALDPTLLLTADLIRCPSITPDPAGTLDLLCNRLAPLGFRCQRMDRNGIANLWAEWGEARPLIVFAGHVDVVPTGEASLWTSPPFEPTIRNGQLFGRGSADMKASIAAFIVALERLMARGLALNGSIGLLITADEEGDAHDGTVAVVDHFKAQGRSIDACIIGEPSSVKLLGDCVKVGRRGSLHGKMTVHGIQGHIAYPHLARNPVHQLARLIARLAATEWDAGNEFFPPTTWQVSNIHSGTGALNVIPGHAEARFNFRFSTASTPESLKQRVEERIEEERRAHPELPLDVTLEWTLGAAPFLTRQGRLFDSVKDAIRQVCGLTTEASTSGGTSDGRFIAEICQELVELGPINASIHQIDEHIAVADLEKLAQLYQNVLERLLTHD